MNTETIKIIVITGLSSLAILLLLYLFLYIDACFDEWRIEQNE